MDAITQRNQKLGERTVRALKERRFEAVFCPTAEQAAQAVISFIPEGHTVSWGGAESMRQLGVFVRVRKSFAVIDRSAAADPAEADAYARARFLAAPVNAQRFPLSTPCRQDGVCHNCKSPDCICAQLVATRLCRPAGRIKVVICGEPLGF